MGIRALRAQSGKARFLRAYSETGNIYRACVDANVDRRTIYKWQEHDDQFALAMRQAEIEAIERLEEEARRRAYDGVVREKGVYYQGARVGSAIVTEYSDSLLMFLLKGLKPEKYKERLEVSAPAIVKSYQGVDVDQV